MPSCAGEAFASSTCASRRAPLPSDAEALAPWRGAHVARRHVEADRAYAFVHEFHTAGQCGLAASGPALWKIPAMSLQFLGFVSR